MDFLTNYLGKDVFSILHKYIGDIIEELSCDRINFCDLPFDAKLILKNAIKNGAKCILGGEIPKNKLGYN